MTKNKSTVRVGVVGGGFVAQMAHLASFAHMDGCEIAGIAELRPGLRHAVAEKFGVPVAVETHHELLARDDIDAVVVVTRRNATGPVVLDALNAGKHVLSEKPMAHTSAAAARLVAAARDMGVVYRVGFMKRHDALARTAKAFVAEKRMTGAAGKIQYVRCYSHAGDDGRDTAGLVMTDEPRPDGLELWRAGPDWLESSMLGSYDDFLNIHVHIVNLARELLAEPMKVLHFDLNPGAVSIASVHFGDSPGVCEFASRPLSEWHEGIEVYFERGHVSLRFAPPFAKDAFSTLSWTDQAGSVSFPEPLFKPVWPFEAQAQSFIGAVRAGADDAASAQDNIDDLIAIEAMWRQIDTTKLRGTLT